MSGASVFEAFLLVFVSAINPAALVACAVYLDRERGFRLGNGLLIGGLLMLLVYLIPVVGFIVYKLLGILGLGVVVYTLILLSRSADRQAAEQAAAASRCRHARRWWGCCRHCRR